MHRYVWRLQVLFVFIVLGCSNGGQTGELMNPDAKKPTEPVGDSGDFIKPKFDSGTPIEHDSGEPSKPAPDAGGFPQTEPFRLVKSSLSREENPELSVEQQSQFADSNTLFATEMYQQLTRDLSGENIFFSPYSISVALAMTYAGAKGETKQEMADTLHFDLEDEDLHAAFNRLDLLLNSRGESQDDEPGDPFRLTVVNSLWGQYDIPFLDPFLDTLAVNYGAGIRLLDFRGAPEPSRETINLWVEEQTEKRIQDLLPEGSIIPETDLCLVNAIYFNASWLNPFEEEQTRESDFHNLSGSSVSVPFMNLTKEFGYFDADGFQAVEIPYRGEELSMVILMPDEDQFVTFESELSPDLLNQALDAIVETQISLSMPSWELSPGTIRLKDTLRPMGMIRAFEDADFTAMEETHKLFIDNVYHQAFIKVDEKGTEAAAATAVVMVWESMSPNVKLDRPFIYLIRDIESKTILFLGRVVEL